MSELLLLILYHIICVSIYPLVTLIALWNYRDSQVKTFNFENFKLTIPFRLPTFAYPLPRLRRYLYKFAKQQGITTALHAIQQLQTLTLQRYVSRKVAQDLANHPETGISFCGEVAIQTNNATLLPLSVTGNVGRAVAVLAKPQEKEDEQPLRLWIDNFPPRKAKWLEGFNTTRKSHLSARLEYALQVLQPCQDYQNVTAYQKLLETLLQYDNATQLNEMLSIAEQPLAVPTQYPQWLQGGWTILQDFTQQLTDFKNYRRLESAKARRQYLTRQQKKLEALDWQALPEYWAAIGNE